MGVKAEFLRGVLNHFDSEGLDLNVLDLQVASVVDDDPIPVTGLVEISISEDGLSGTLTIGIE